MIKATITKVETVGINITFKIDIENEETKEKLQENFSMKVSEFKDMDIIKVENYIKEIIQQLIQARLDSIPDLEATTGQWKKASLFLNKEFIFDFKV